MCTLAMFNLNIIIFLALFDQLIEIYVILCNFYPRLSKILRYYLLLCCICAGVLTVSHYVVVFKPDIS